MDLEETQRSIDQVMIEHNHRSIPELEGYSPFEMHQILHFTFGKDCPIQLQKLSDSDYKKIPMLNQIKYLTDLIDKSGEIIFIPGLYKKEYKGNECLYISYKWGQF